MNLNCMFMRETYFYEEIPRLIPTCVDIRIFYITVWLLFLFVFVHLLTKAQTDDRAVQLYCLSLQSMIRTKTETIKIVNTYWIIIRKTTHNKHKC